MPWMIIFLLFMTTQAFASTLSSPITNKPDPFGPLGKTNSRTTNIYWINRAGYLDYVDIIYRGSAIQRCLVNANTAAGAGNIRIIDIWNGTNDAGAPCSPATYDAKIKVSRTSVFNRIVPPSGSYVELQEPRDLACDRFGNVYVLDRALLTVQKFSSDGVLLMKYRFSAGTGNGQLNLGTYDWGGLTVDTNLFFYISDQGAANGRIQRFTNQNGSWSATYQAPNAADDNFSGCGYDARSNRIFTAALADAAVHSIRADTLAGLTKNSNAGNPANMRDFAVVQNGTGPADYIFTVTGANVYRWSRRAAANGYENNAAPANLGNGLTDTRGITQRSNKYVLIAGSGAHQIRQLSTNGAILETRGSLGYGGDTNFWAPSGIAWDAKNDLIWVSDTSNMRLVCWRKNSSGNLEMVKKIETAPYLLRNPQDIAIDKNGNLFIIDKGLCKVKKFDPNGSFLLEFGGRGRGNGKFWDPRGLAVDDDGYIYVSDQGTANGDDAEDQIEKFDASGNFIRAWNHPDGRGMMSFMRNGSNFIVAIGQTDGSTRDCAMRVYWTNGIVIQSWRNSYDDTDYGDIDRDYLGRWYCIDSAGASYVDTFAANSTGSVAPQYVGIGGTRAGLSIDPYGSLWVPNQASSQVEVRQSYAVGTPATLLFAFSGPGSGDGLLNNPTYCAIRMRELPGNWADLWVVDSGNQRLQKFIINWTSEVSEPVTLSGIGAPIVTAAYPDPAASTNATLNNGIYYARKGKAVFKVYFSQVMNTNIKPTVRFTTLDSYTYNIQRTNFMGNVWTGTAWIPTSHDGASVIRVQDAQNKYGSNLNPNPTILYDAFVIDTVPPSVDVIDPLDGSSTTLTNTLADGTTEASIRVDIFNWSASSGGALISSRSNETSTGTGDFMVNSLKLITPKDSTNFITARAKDRAGNWGDEHVPRHLLRCIDAFGYAFVEPATNRRLGDTGNPPVVFTWQANANMINGTVTGDVPSGWSPPSTNKAAAGYVRLLDYSGITFATAKTLMTGNAVYPRRFKVNFTSASIGGYFKIIYATNTRTMVSNSYSVAIGLNEWAAKATNTTLFFTNIWEAPTKVGEASGKTLKIPVKGKPVLVKFTNLMPVQIYRGASDVLAMSLFFINSNKYHSDEIDSFILTTKDAANNSVNANTRLSAISLYTSNILLASTLAGASPSVVLDFSASPLVVRPGKTNKVDVKMNIPVTTTATDLKLELASMNNVTARNYQNNSGVIIDVSGAFPMRTTYVVIRSNQPAQKLFTLTNNVIPGWVDIKQQDVNSMRVIFRNTNANVNDVQVYELRMDVENSGNSGVIPDAAIDKVTLQKKNYGFIYAQKTPVETSGQTIFLFPKDLYIPPRSSITCDVRLNIKTNVAATNFRLDLTASSNILARDKNITSLRVTNYPYPPLVFPMRTEYAEIAHHFQIVHNGSVLLNQWSPVKINVMNVSNHRVKRYGGVLTLDTTGTPAAMDWTNNYSHPGIFTQGPLGDEATYQFVGLDYGVVTLSIKDSTAESVDVIAKDSYIVDNNTEGFLKFLVWPDIRISKTVIPNTARPFEAVTYAIRYSNASGGSAYKMEMVEAIPTNMVYLTNSAEVSNTLHAGTVTVYYATNLTNLVWLPSSFDNITNTGKIKKIRWVLSSTVNANNSGFLKFKTFIR